VSVNELQEAIAARPVAVAASAPPQLFVVVDTEEEFDWNAPFSRANTSVRAIRHIHRLQNILDRFKLRPTYVVDYPIASQADGVAPLKEIADSGRAQIGAHLHPWVSPPYVEEVSGPNSFGCGLGRELEFEKIRILRDEITAAFGTAPRSFKAGRYGFGPSTASILEELGFAIDLSVNPRMNYLAIGGPTFDAFNAQPFTFGRNRRLLEVPCTTDYIGVAGPLSATVHRFASTPSLQALRLQGICARLGIVNKVMLSPEGSTLDEMKALARTLLRRGVRTFSFTLHSPSVEPGCTPYVRNAGDLERFLGSIAAFCEFFVTEMNGVPGTPDDYLASLPAAVAATH